MADFHFAIRILARPDGYEITHDTDLSGYTGHPRHAEAVTTRRGDPMSTSTTPEPAVDPTGAGANCFLEFHVIHNPVAQLVDARIALVQNGQVVTYLAAGTYTSDDDAPHVDIELNVNTNVIERTPVGGWATFEPADGQTLTALCGLTGLVPHGKVRVSVDPIQPFDPTQAVLLARRAIHQGLRPVTSADDAPHDWLSDGLRRIAERAHAESTAGAPPEMIAYYVDVECEHLARHHDGPAQGCEECNEAAVRRRAVREETHG